jgi:hypothetical protein
MKHHTPRNQYDAQGRRREVQGIKEPTKCHGPVKRQPTTSNGFAGVDPTCVAAHNNMVVL